MAENKFTIETFKAVSLVPDTAETTKFNGIVLNSGQ
jgi:hypothetical protein